MEATLQAVSGALPVPERGVLLPHEHLFLDLRAATVPGYAQADPEEVLAVMWPYLTALQAQGVVGLIECSTVGVGRNVAILRRLAQATGLAIVAPTGVYAEPAAPAWVRRQSEAALEAWMRGEIEDAVDVSGVRAGFIKLASSPQDLTHFEERVLRAAARVALATGVAIASHTTRGATALRQLDILAEEGLPAERFVWVHAHMEPDRTLHEAAARRGAYVEYDNIGAHLLGASNPFPKYALADATAVDLVARMVEAGHTERVLLSQDAGWYDAARATGGAATWAVRGFTFLLDRFVPRLEAAGLREAIPTIIERNPWRAFARRANVERSEAVCG